jgi:TolB protein
MQPVRPRSFFALAIASLALAARAQAPEVHVATGEGVQRFVIDVPRFAGDADTDALVRRVIRDDLFFSGLFEFVPEGAAAPWRVEGVIEQEGEQVAVTFTLKNTVDARVEGAKKYRSDKTALRRVAHRIAEEILRILTGQEGGFDTRIAFVSNLGDQRDINVMDYDGANVARVTRDGALVLSPEVSPDGQLLLFTSYVSGKPAVYLVRRDTGEIRKLFSREGLNQSPAFSPDGQTIAFSAAFEGNSEIYLSDLLGKNLHRLTDNEAIDVSPAWSPTGKEIAFTSDRGGTPQIYVMSADGLETRRVTTEGAYNSDPAWSPDGTTLAYASRQDGRFQTCLLDVASGKVTTITDGRANYESPSWSPNGEYLAIASDRDGRYDIWIMRRDGSTPRRIGTRGENRFPCWYR